MYIWNPNRPQESLGHRMAWNTKHHPEWDPLLPYFWTGKSIIIQLTLWGIQKWKINTYNQLPFLGVVIYLFCVIFVRRDLSGEIRDRHQLHEGSPGSTALGSLGPKITGRYTPSKLNSNFAPENRPKLPQEETIVFPSSIFQGRCVSFTEIVPKDGSDRFFVAPKFNIFPAKEVNIQNSYSSVSFQLLEGWMS